MRLVSRLQNMRHAGDYDDMFDWAEEDVKPLFNRTEPVSYTHLTLPTNSLV